MEEENYFRVKWHLLLHFNETLYIFTLYDTNETALHESLITRAQNTSQTFTIQANALYKQFHFDRASSKC